MQPNSITKLLAWTFGAAAADEEFSKRHCYLRLSQFGGQPASMDVSIRYRC